MTSAPAPWLVRRLRALGISADSAAAIASGVMPSGGSPGDYDAAGVAAGLMATHVAALDPHPQYQTSSEVSSAITAAIDALVAGAPGTLDTLNEIASQLATDESAAAALTTVVAGKLAKASNLADLPDVAAARTALGLGSAALLASTAFATAAQGTKADAAIPAPSSHVDGRVVAWSDALGRYTEVNAVGSSILASAKNVSGTVTSCSASSGVGAAVDIPGVTISVPDSGGRAVTLRFGAVWQQTVAADGVALLNLVETTGAATTLRASYQRLPNTTTTPMAYFSTPTHEIDIGVVTTTRTFKLQCGLWTATTAPSANVLNGATNPTFLRAIAGA